MARIVVEQKGRRFYLVGDTYSVKDQLKSAGCKWDAAERAWWTGKQEVAAELVARLNGSTNGSTNGTTNGNSESLAKDARSIKGKATYQGKTYLLLWSGTTKRGEAAKLAFRDGSKVFWADLAAVAITKTYREPVSLAQLDRWAQEYRDAGGDAELVAERRAERSGRCRECGGPLVDVARHEAMGGLCGSCAFDEYDM